MNCDVIRDLLPSYADGICSPASQTLVQEHLAQCPACQKALEQMRQPRRVPATPRAKNPLRLLRRRQIIALLLAIVLTAAVVVTAYQVVLNVDAVHSLFFPIQWGRVENATDWTPVQFETGEFLVLDSGFYDKAVTNDANSAWRRPDPRAGCRRESGGGDARHRPRYLRPAFHARTRYALPGGGIGRSRFCNSHFSLTFFVIILRLFEFFGLKSLPLVRGSAFEGRLVFVYLWFDSVSR